MKYRRVLTGAVIVPTFIFLSGIGLTDEAQAGTGKDASTSSGEKSSSGVEKPADFKPGASFKNDFKKVGATFKPAAIERPKIETPKMNFGPGSSSRAKKSSSSKSKKK